MLMILTNLLHANWLLLQEELCLGNIDCEIELEKIHTNNNNFDKMTKNLPKGSLKSVACCRI